MRQRIQTILAICTGSLAAALGAAEPIPFAPLGTGAGEAARAGQPRAIDGPGMSFCIRFGDDAVATAMPGLDAPNAPVTLGSGHRPMLSAYEARHVLWSWALGPVVGATGPANADLAGLFMIEGGLDAATLGQGFSSIPDLGDDSRFIGFLQTSDSYVIDHGRAGFITMMSQPVVIPLPSAFALAGAGLLVLGARRRA